MARSHLVLGIFVVWGVAGPACSGSEFSADDDGENAGEAGESGGNGGSSGNGGSNGGASGSANGGRNNGGASGSASGGNSGGGTSGSSTGGDAGEGGEGATGGGGTSGGAGGSSGMATGGRGGMSGSGGAGGNGGSSGVAGSGGRGGTSGLGGTGGGPTGGTGGVVVAGNCPINPPSASTPCAGSDYCAYGTHPLSSCREIYSCIGGGFRKSQDACPIPPFCEDATNPPIVGAACSPEGLECRLDQTVFCMCAMDCPSACTPQTVWHCFGPPPGCPTVLPNHGQPCSGSTTCSYGTCPSQTAINAVCEAGVVRWRSRPCPQ